jgi:copper chaperone CopZ
MKRMAIGFVGLALVLTACQSAAETLTEQIAGQVEGVDGVDIDLDSGQVSVETDEGSITIGGGEMPDGFAIPAPDGYKVTSVFTSDDTASVSLAYPGADFDTIVSFYDDWTGNQSNEWSKSTSSITGDDGTIDSASWFDDEGSGFINISNLCLVADDSIDSDDCISVNLNTTG